MKRLITKTYSLVIRIAAVAAVAGVVLYLGSRALVPSGRLATSTDLVRPAPFLSEPKPSERVVFSEDGRSRSVIGHPVYMDIRPPSVFDTVSLRLTYENTGQPLVEIGALASSLEWQFELVPAENRLLDMLPWSRVSSGHLTLLQRDGTYASIDEFFREPPDRDTVAVYRAEAVIPYRIQDYEPATANRTIELSLRGHHRLWTYVKDETLLFTFIVQDMNRQEGADPVTVSVYRDGDNEHAIARAVLQDDGNTRGDQHSSELRTVSVSVADLAEGPYQIEFTAPGDVFIRRIVTAQKKLVFSDKIYLGDHVGYSDRMDPLTVLSDGERFVMRTSHNEALQTISVGSEEIMLTEPLARHIVTMEEAIALKRITSPKRDVLMETDGVFSLSEDEYFIPRPFALQWYTQEDDLKERGIAYILTSYEPPERDGMKVVTEATYDLAALARTEKGAYRFVLATPGISELGHELRIEDVTVTLQRPPVTPGTFLESLKRLFAPKERAVQQRIIGGGKTYDEYIP